MLIWIYVIIIVCVYNEKMCVYINNKKIIIFFFLYVDNIFIMCFGVMIIYLDLK